MASNLRAKPMEGHVTDSAGNVRRNAQIIIKQDTPEGSFAVDTVTTDDTGYFSTKPIPGGVYNIFESGIFISKTIHSSDKNAIQSFKAHVDNYNILSVKNFETLAAEESLNSFQAFIQIEPAEIDISQYGSTFPIYDLDITTDPNFENEDDLWNLSQFCELNKNSRITTTRFDIEYYAPITAFAKNYRRIRWSGMPAIRYYESSKLVIPIDYFSMVLNMPRIISPNNISYKDKGQSNYVTATSGTGEVANLESLSGTLEPEFKNAVNGSKIGDVVKLIVENSSDLGATYLWYGIIIGIEISDDYSLTLEKLRSSRYPGPLEVTIDLSSSDDFFIKRMFVYDGMFSGIVNINEEVNERFSAVENIGAQDLGVEIYNYNDRFIEIAPPED